MAVVLESRKEHIAIDGGGIFWNEEFLHVEALCGLYSDSRRTGNWQKDVMSGLRGEICETCEEIQDKLMDRHIANGNEDLRA